MKHAELRAIVHNVADSLASGIGLLVGHYQTDVYGEARGSAEQTLTVDFRNGLVTDGQPSTSLSGAVALYQKALGNLLAEAGGSLECLREAKVRYWSDPITNRFSVSIEDSNGRRSTTEYAGVTGKRVLVKDQIGRLRPKPIVR